MTHPYGSDDDDDRALATIREEFEAGVRVLVRKFGFFAKGEPDFARRLLAEVLDPALKRMRDLAEADAGERDEAYPRPLAPPEPDPPAAVVRLDRRVPAPPTAPANYVQQSSSDVQTFIQQILFHQGAPMRVDEIQAHLDDSDHPVSPANLSVILHRMVRNGLIARPNRGLYAVVEVGVGAPRRIGRDER